jgi:hypothetical protein
MHQLHATKPKPMAQRPARPAARLPPPAHQQARWTDLQRGIGNHAVSCLPQWRAHPGASVQTRHAPAQLRIGAPHDGGRQKLAQLS